jgi:hypothetical protein
MSRLNIAEARELWRNAINAKHWQGSVLERVMFDWTRGKKSNYHPDPPAFRHIADHLQTVDEQEYRELVNSLIQLGERQSELGRRRGAGHVVAVAPACTPLPLERECICRAINEVMATVHPKIVRQEQILRCALIAHLPQNIREAIGTLSANVHPELPTPSNEYQRKGNTQRRARIDVGFGHGAVPEQLVGVIELKALTSFNELWFRRQEERLHATPPNLMFSGLAGDFQKLLDRKLPKHAFRYSWVVTRNWGRGRPDEIARWARSIVRPVEKRLSLEGFEETYDAMTRWLVWKWKDGTILHLAWYSPNREASEKFLPVWTIDSAMQAVP